MLLDCTIISDSFCFWGLRRRIGGHARDLGFVHVFCRPSLLIYMLWESLSQKFWLNSLSFVLFCLAMWENKSSIDGHHVKPVLGLGYLSYNSSNHSIGSDSILQPYKSILCIHMLLVSNQSSCNIARTLQILVICVLMGVTLDVLLVNFFAQEFTYSIVYWIKSVLYYARLALFEFDANLVFFTSWRVSVACFVVHAQCVVFTN